MTRDFQAYHSTRFVFDPRRDLVWSEIARFLQRRYIRPDDNVLDLGAGYCHFINHVIGNERYAVDIFPDVAKYASPGVVAHVGSCTSLPQIGRGRLDVVFCSNLFEHLSREDLHLTLAEARRMLRPGGRLIALQPNFAYCWRRYFDDYTHVQIFTHKGLADLAAAYGFRPIEVRPRFLPFSMETRLPIRPWIVRLYLNSPAKPLAGQMLIVAERTAGDA